MASGRSLIERAIRPEREMFKEMPASPRHGQRFKVGEFLMREDRAERRIVKRKQKQGRPGRVADRQPIPFSWADVVSRSVKVAA